MKFVKKLLPVLVVLFLLCMTLTVFASEGTAAAAAETGAPVSSASPAAGNTGSGPSMWVILIFYVVIFGGLGYLLIFRPQKKRRKQEEELRSSIILGDEVVTIGGIVGRVVNIKDDDITIETSIDRTLMQFKNWAIREVKKLETDDDRSAEKTVNRSKKSLGMQRKKSRTQRRRTKRQARISNIHISFYDLQKM